MLIGGVFFGAVTDFGALYASVKNEGKSMGLLIEKYIGKTGRKRYSCSSAGCSTCIVIAAFADMVAGTFNAYTVKPTALPALCMQRLRQTAPQASISIACSSYLPMVFGLLQKKLNLDRHGASSFVRTCMHRCISSLSVWHFPFIRR